VTLAPLNELLCVHCPEDKRPELFVHLRRLHPGAHVQVTQSGWLVVSSPLPRAPSAFGTSALPRSPFTPTDSQASAPVPPATPPSGDVFFALGEERLVCPDSRNADLERLHHLASNTPQRLKELPGDFTFIALDAAGTAVAVRSCSGVPRLYTFCKDSVTAVGTRLEWVARVYPRPLRLDVQRLVSDEHALGIAPNHASAVEGISIVPVGHAARCGKWESPRLTDYWQLEGSHVRHSPEELARELERRLLADLHRHLDSNAGSNVLLFSGGLDSSTLAGLCHDAGLGLSAVSILPPAGHPALPRERYYVRSLRHQFFQHVVRPLEPEPLLAALSAHPGSLSPIVASEWQALANLGAPPTSVLTGWFADECFGYLRTPESLRTWTPDLTALYRSRTLRHFPKTWWRRRRAGRHPFHTDGLDVSPPFAPSAVPHFVGWLRAATWFPRPEQPAEQLRFHRKLTDMAGAYADAAAEFGARVVAPFASRDVVELAATCSVGDLYRDGLTKAPLRSIAARHLPPTLARRPDKGDWGLDGHRVPRPAIPPELSHLLDTNYLRDHPTLLLDEVGTIAWVAALERGRVRIEHERRTIWSC
jgi:asparagine synthetase B (glutamine-hydrolysing)